FHVTGVQTCALPISAAAVSRTGRRTVPLSEHEQRAWEQMTESLAEDPKFASAVRASDPRVRARRRLLLALVVVLAGLALVVYGRSEERRVGEEGNAG